MNLLNASFIFIVIRKPVAPLVYGFHVVTCGVFLNIAIEGVMNFAALFGVYLALCQASVWIVYWAQAVWSSTSFPHD